MTRTYGQSDPEYHGVPDNQVICARIEGIRKEHSDTDSVEALGYEAEHVHLHCLWEGRSLFKEIHDEDTKVLAGELDWAGVYICPVCSTSIL